MSLILFQPSRPLADFILSDPSIRMGFAMNDLVFSPLHTLQSLQSAIPTRKYANTSLPRSTRTCIPSLAIALSWSGTFEIWTQAHLALKMPDISRHWWWTRLRTSLHDQLDCTVIPSYHDHTRFSYTHSYRLILLIRDWCVPYTLSLNPRVFLIILNNRHNHFTDNVGRVEATSGWGKTSDSRRPIISVLFWASRILNQSPQSLWKSLELSYIYSKTIFLVNAKKTSCGLLLTSDNCAFLFLCI